MKTFFFFFFFFFRDHHDFRTKLVFVWETQTIFLSYPKCTLKSWFGQTSQNSGKTSLPPQNFLGWYGYVNRWSVGVGRSHPVTMRKASFRSLSIRRVWTTRHQTGAQYSAVEQTRDRAAFRGVLAPTPHAEPTNRLSSVTCEDSYLCNATRSMILNLVPRQSKK